MDIVERIDAHYEQERAKGGRSHLGLSEIGEPCDRYIWLAHNGAKSSGIEGRVLRLFYLGEVIERVVIQDFAKIGMYVMEQQKKVKIEHEPSGQRLRGSCDGILHGLDNEPRLLEIKSANANSFKKLQQTRYEMWNPKYKAQIHAYMYGLDIPKGLAVVYCKDNSEMYMEEINLDRAYIENRLHTVFGIMQMEKIPPHGGCPMFDPSWCRFMEGCHA